MVVQLLGNGGLMFSTVVVKRGRGDIAAWRRLKAACGWKPGL